MPETNLAGAAVVADRLRLAVADQPFTLHDRDEKLPVTVSIGVAVTQDGGESLDALLKRADDALYAAKNGGRNRVVAAPPSLSRMPIAIASCRAKPPKKTPSPR
jgi:two-component system, cell cycle response regulator